MAQQHINIRLSLKDEITAPLKNAAKKVQEFGQHVDQVGRQISSIGTKMTFFGTAITGAFTLAMNSARKYSVEVNRVMQEMGNSFEQLWLTVAEAVLPIFEKISNAISNVVENFKQMDPEVRDMILQMTLMAGAALLAGGIFLKAFGTAISIIGKLRIILTPLGLAVTAIAAAVYLMVKHWENVRTFVIPVVNGLQIAVDMVAIGCLKVVDAVFAMSEAFGGFGNMMKKMTEQMLMFFGIPAAMARVFDPIFNKMNANLKENRKHIQNTIAGIEDDMKKAMSGKGVGDALDQGIRNWRVYFEQVQNLFKQGTAKAKEQIFEWANFTKEITKQVARSMEQSLGGFFFDALTGQLKSAQEMFADFGRAILQILTQALAKLLLFFTIGRVLQPYLGFNMFGSYHQGGTVRRAHTGMMSHDEVPIIAQAGEGIVSRKGMAQLGKGNFDRLNRGDAQDQGQPTIVINQVIQAWDARDVARNKKALAAGLIEELRNNSAFRRAVIQYT